MPIFRFKWNRDINVTRQRIQMEGSMQNGLQNQIRRQSVPIEDGVSMGCVEDFLNEIPIGIIIIGN